MVADAVKSGGRGAPVVSVIVPVGAFIGGVVATLDDATVVSVDE